MRKSQRFVSFVLILCLWLTGCATGGEEVVTSMEEGTTTTTTAPTTTTTTATTTTGRSTTTARKLITAKPTTTVKPTTVKPTTAKPTTAGGNGVRIAAEYISQTGFPTGCESASATMLLRFWKVDMTLDTFVDRYLDKGAIRHQADGMYAPHPADKFVGDPRSEAAYGCYAPVIVRAVRRCLPSGLGVIDETGKKLPQLCREYLDAGMPVMVWVTIGMVPVAKGGSWKTDNTGQRFEWKANEHCMLLVGYDSSRYYLLDPYKNRGLVSFPRQLVESRYADMGCQAVGIQPVSPTKTTASTTTMVTETDSSITTATEITDGLPESTTLPSDTPTQTE